MESSVGTSITTTATEMERELQARGTKYSARGVLWRQEYLAPFLSSS
jgi:hypothetical protein